MGTNTVLPEVRYLDGIDHLAIETARHLYPNACRQQQEIQESQVPLPIPWDGILL